MWVLEKIRESVENIPSELSRVIGKSEENIFDYKTRLSQKLHSNVLTPDRIPEFCLPPRLCRTNPLQEADTPTPHLNWHKETNQKSTFSHVKMNDVKSALPFSAEGYGLSGLYESPNTRRKESLFHSKLPLYVLDKRIATAAPKLAKETNHPRKTVSGFFPRLACKNMSETGSTGSETPSSSDSSPLSSPYSAKSSVSFLSGRGRLKGATSCPVLTGNMEETGTRLQREAWHLKISPSSPPSSFGSSLTLAPPVLLPLDVLQCQERLQREHVIPLQGRGKVRLSAESTTFSSNAFLSLSTVRIRLVSVEGLQEDTDPQVLNCAVSLCLTPGKLQLQKSATIRTCRSPVFNEDFFFTALSREDLLELHLRVKVLDKPAAGPLRRRTVIGVFTKPLAQLLHLNKRE